jgi:serine protease Do
MQWSTARAFLLAAALASGSPHGRAAESSRAPGLVAQELSAVVSISGLRPLHPPTSTTTAGVSGTGTSGPGTSGVGTSGVGTSGVGTSGVGTSGVGTSGVGTSGVGTSGVGTSGVGTSATSTSASGTSAANGAAERPTEPRPPRRSRVLGSGFIIDPSGIIITNRHVIEGMTDILVTLQDNSLLRATVLAQADQIDVALLKVTADSPLPSIRWGDSDTLRVADEVLAIGNPLGFGGSVTQGIVSALNRDIRDTPFDDYIQTDAAINHGNSGGPLFNMRGEVVGMNTAIFAPAATSGSIGLGFAIPSNDVRFAAEALRNPGGMRPGTLDFRLQQVTPGLADALNMPKAEGVIVGGTKEGGAAAKCGIVAGDIILRYGTMEVKDVRALARAIARTKPGTVVNLLVWHNEDPKLIAATVQALPPVASPVPAPPAPAASPADPGWTLAPIDDATRRTYGLRGDQTGVVVAQIAADGTAADAGLNLGDVIVEVQQETIAGPEDVVRLIALARQQQRLYVAMLVHNADGLRWLALSLD